MEEKSKETINTYTENIVENDTIDQLEESDETLELKLSDTEIDSDTEQELLSENLNIISHDTIDHQTSKQNTVANEAGNDNSFSEAHNVDLQTEMKSTVEEEHNTLHVECTKDSDNPLSTNDSTQVNKVSISESYYDSNIITGNVVIDSVKQITVDEMNIDKSNASNDSTNENTEKEMVLLNNVTNVPKDIHTETERSLNTQASDSHLDVNTAESSKNLKKSLENPDESGELDSNNQEKIFQQENVQTEVEDVSDVNMSQDMSMDLGSKQHGLKQPNMMIEIPTQELVDIDSIIDNTSDASVNSEDKNCEDISSLVDKLDNRNKEIDKEFEKLAESTSQENCTQREIEDLTEKEISEGTITFAAFEVQGGKSSYDKIDSKLPIEIPKEIDTTQPEDLLPKDIESSPSKENNMEQISIQENSKVLCENQEETSKVELYNSVATQIEPSLSDQYPSSDMEPQQAPTTSHPSTSQESFLSNESSASKNTVMRQGYMNEPSTSNQAYMSMAPDTSDEVPEVSDSLGLLAESSRVMEDDEEQETSEHDDEDDDFDPDDGKLYLILQEKCNHIKRSLTYNLQASHSFLIHFIHFADFRVDC